MLVCVDGYVVAFGLLGWATYMSLVGRIALDGMGGKYMRGIRWSRSRLDWSTPMGSF